MKKLVLLLASLLMPIISLMAQTEIYEVPNIATPKASIIKDWQNQKQIAYIESSAHGFMIVDLNNTNLLLADLPNSIEVTDFEIYKQWVFFCGRNAASNVGIIGYFDINDLFYGGGSYQYFDLYSSTSNPLRRVLKMDLLPVSDGIHLILAGETYCSTCQELMVRSFLDVPFDLTLMQPVLSATSGITELSGIEYYDDVVITDNYVVSIGHKHQSEGIYFRLFNKPTTIATDIFSVSTLWHNIHAEYYATELVLGTHLFGDVFATVSHARVYPEWGTQITLFSGSTLVSKFFINQLSTSVGPKWKLKDINYDPVEKQLYVLEDMDFPLGSTNLNSVIVKFNPFSAPTTFNGYFAIQKDWQSLDNTLNPWRSIVIGGERWSGPMYLARIDYNDSPCVKMITQPLSTLPPNGTDFPVQITPDTYKFQDYFYCPTITSMKPELICPLE